MKKVQTTLVSVLLAISMLCVASCEKTGINEGNMPVTAQSVAKSGPGGMDGDCTTNLYLRMVIMIVFLSLSIASMKSLSLLQIHHLGMMAPKGEAPLGTKQPYLKQLRCMPRIILSYWPISSRDGSQYGNYRPQTHQKNYLVYMTVMTRVISYIHSNSLLNNKLL